MNIFQLKVSPKFSDTEIPHQQDSGRLLDDIECYRKINP